MASVGSFTTKVGSIYNRNIQFANSGDKNIINFYGYSGDAVSGLVYQYPYSGMTYDYCSGEAMSMLRSGNVYLASLNAAHQIFSGANYVSGVSRYGVNSFYSSVTYSGTVNYTSTIGVYAPTKTGGGTVNYNCALYAENTSNDGIINVAIYANGSSEFRSCADARPVMKIAGYSATQSAGLVNFYRDASGAIVSVVDCSGSYLTSGDVTASGTVTGGFIKCTSSNGFLASTSAAGQNFTVTYNDVALADVVTLVFTDGILTSATTGGCFIGTTLILMSDYTLKEIRDIEVGDTVMTFDTKTKTMQANKVLEVKQFETEKQYISINGELHGVTPEQHVYANDIWIKAGKLQIGDIMFKSDMQPKMIQEISYHDCDESVYDLLLADDAAHTYFADGFLVYDWNYSKDNARQ